MTYKQTWKSLRDKIHLRDGWICVYCGNFGNHVDHVIPWQHGGKSRRENLVACCQSCNKKKGHKLIPEMIAKALKHLALLGEDFDWIDNL